MEGLKVRSSASLILRVLGEKIPTLIQLTIFFLKIRKRRRKLWSRKNLLNQLVTCFPTKMLLAGLEKGKKKLIKEEGWQT
jgi:hypothetical protein